MENMQYVPKLVFLSYLLFYFYIFLNSKNTKDINFYIQYILEYIIKSGN